MGRYYLNREDGGDTRFLGRTHGGTSNFDTRFLRQSCGLLCVRVCDTDESSNQFRRRVRIEPKRLGCLGRGTRGRQKRR